MGRLFRSVGLVAKLRSEERGDFLLKLAKWLEEHGVEVVLEVGTAPKGAERRWTVLPFSRLGDAVELVVVLGGDGTLLHAARHLVEHEVPLVGVNLGRVGFLTDIRSTEAIEALAAILDGEFVEEERALLSASVQREGAVVVETTALNDVVVTRGDLGRMIEFDLWVNGRFVYRQRADGMIVTTPTGSTAYALSANGPILHPHLCGIALVPLCPHTLTARPIVLGAEATVELALLPGHVADLYFDGQGRVAILPSDRLLVGVAERTVRLLHPPDYDYFATLREKLHWNAAPR
ncbi:MAG: NAD(+) kinase [Hydrogenophilus sp.]|nr:NAD(+) kinase [Hydrogenophilus sp.]